MNDALGKLAEFFALNWNDMNLSTIKVIAFDLDGTLLNSVPDLAAATNKALLNLGYPEAAISDVGEWVGNGADALMARAINGSMDTHWSSEALAEKARAAFYHHYEQISGQYSELYPAAEETLVALKQQGYTLALVTNKPSQFVPHILQSHKLDSLFSQVFGGDCVEHRKPHPEALLRLMAQFNVSKEQILMVGDSKNDILAAKNAGCLSVGLTYGYNHGEPIANANPDKVIDSLSELLVMFGLG